MWPSPFETNAQFWPKTYTFNRILSVRQKFNDRQCIGVSRLDSAELRKMLKLFILKPKLLFSSENHKNDNSVETVKFIYSCRLKVVVIRVVITRKMRQGSVGSSYSIMLDHIKWPKMRTGLVWQLLVGDCILKNDNLGSKMKILKFV